MTDSNDVKMMEIQMLVLALTIVMYRCQRQLCELKAHLYVLFPLSAALLMQRFFSRWICIVLFVAR